MLNWTSPRNCEIEPVANISRVAGDAGIGNPCEFIRAQGPQQRRALGRPQVVAGQVRVTPIGSRHHRVERNQVVLDVAIVETALDRVVPLEVTRVVGEVPCVDSLASRTVVL